MAYLTTKSVAKTLVFNVEWVGDQLIVSSRGLTGGDIPDW